MTSDELRSAFLSFFESKGHKIIPSSSLIPQGDPTLLLTSAGMVQIKPYFLGEAVPPSPRLVSCQKCFRTTDIESVGDSTHLTFFEMLGNFSVGDYFKEEAISWAWEFVTQWLKLPVERLWVTVFLDDDEAFSYWGQMGVPEERILRFGEEDNFWGPVGDSGPCGPCSEIFYDFGEEVGCGKPSCTPNCGCARFSEIWNLVFTQYNQDKDGHRSPLPKPNIDTGMGLERTIAAMQSKTSVYETDLFAPLLECVSGLTGKKYGADEITDNAMRIVVEHSRGIAFLIGDGVMPSNEGRGYVLRRLLRRAALFSRRLGLGRPFLAELARTTIKQMQHVYPEIEQRQDFILKVIEQEETRFSETLNTGLRVIEDLLDYRKAHRDAIPELVSFLKDFRPASENAAMVLEQHGFTVGGWILGAYMAHEAISQLTYDFLNELEEGEPAQYILDRIGHWGQQVSDGEAFKLYDTYGFPVELTSEIAASRGFSVDLEGFEREMEKQRERAKASHKFELAEKEMAGFKDKLDIKSTIFVGYQNLKCVSSIVHMLVNYTSINKIKEGGEAELILSDTPFYGEMGGQVGDIGEIRSSSGRFLVTNTIRPLVGTPGSIVHQGHVTQGSFSVGDEVEAEVDRERRLDIARNHTATHLLQAALRRVLGEHIQQRGSLVTPERFTFDFSHLTALMPEEISEVQHIVNERIRQNLAVYDEGVPYKKAIEEGAIALFDEKYGDVVRVLRIGRPPISAELCGGTHVTTTGEIGFFHILGEHSIGAGLRRIEAVTGRGAEAFVERRLSALTNIANRLATEVENTSDRVDGLITELDGERKQRQALESELSRKIAESLLNQAKVINDIKVLVANVPSFRIEILREMSDWLRERLKSVVVVLGTVYEDKPVFLAAVTPDLVAKGYNAGEIVKQVAALTGGGGGGKATLAQAGGKYKDKLDEALKLVESLI
ncbi:alanine--tRNA ligase [Chloroflexota bacterium]